MNFFKKLSASSYLILASGLLTLVGMIIAIFSCSEEGLGMPELPWIIVLNMVSLFASLSIILLSAKKGESFFLTLLYLLSVFSSIFTIWLMIYGKMQVFGTVIFSSLERGYAPAERAAYLGIVSIVFYLVALLVSIVEGFFPFAKKDKAAA